MGEEDDPFAVDVIHLLARYAEAAREALAPPEELPPVVTPRSEVEGPDVGAEQVARQRWQNDEQRLSRAIERYHSMCGWEHDRWMIAKNELLQIYVGARRQELEAVKRVFADPEAKAKLTSTLEERSAVHLRAVGKPVPASPRGAEPADIGRRARVAWADEVSKAATTSLRQEWRTGQKKVLQQLARDMRTDRQAVADVLKEHLATQERMSQAASAAWEEELQKAQEKLDQLAKAYQNSLVTMLEAELQEVRQHALQQAEFFRREIQEATDAEQAEAAVSAAQLRRMKLALIKWQKKYLVDAQHKAQEMNAMDQAIVEREAADDLDDGQQEDGEGDGANVELDPWLVDDVMKAKAHAEAEEAMAADEEAGIVHEDEQAASETLRSSALKRLYREAAVERLEECRIVLDGLWEHQPPGEDEAMAFLRSLEAVVPCSMEVLRLYEEHLAQHGVLSALGALAAASTALEESEAAVFEADGKALNRPGSRRLQKPGSGGRSTFLRRDGSFNHIGTR